MSPSGVSLRYRAAVANPSLRPAFEILDADCDGKISLEDLRSFYSGLSGDAIADEDVIGTMMSAADSNRDGYVEYEEFVRVVERQTRGGGGGGGGGGGVMEEVFRVMDGDGDGKLSREDVMRIMRSAGLDARDEDVEAMVVLGGRGDKEGGGITYDVFLKILGVDDLF